MPLTSHERLEEIEKLAGWILQGRGDHINFAAAILDNCQGLAQHVSELEEALSVIAEDLTTHLADSAEYIAIGRARELAKAAREKILPDYAKRNRIHLKALEALKRVVEAEIQAGHDSKGALQKALEEKREGHGRHHEVFHL